MRFPWQKRETVKVFPNHLDVLTMPWCRQARLLHVKGSGSLRWEGRGERTDNYWGTRYLSRLTLRGTPLLSRDDPGCPTCESMLSTGWGLDTADCPELETVRDTLNGGFARLDDAIPALTPLLGLLERGLYVLSDGKAYPADGGGHFFWDVPDGLTDAPATAVVQLLDDDYEYEYPDSAPVFLYPSQRRSRLDEKRVEYYMERFQQAGPPPRGVALHVAEGLSILLDGHHKAAAAARLGRMMPCLTILPAVYDYEPVQVPGYPPVSTPTAAWFGPFHVRARDLPGAYPNKYLPQKPFYVVKGSQRQLPEGRLADREWPDGYRAAGGRYPTMREYAVVSAAELPGYPTDSDLARWLADPLRYRPQLRAALVLLRGSGSPRLKDLALCCAGLPYQWSSLVEESFRVLAEMHGDPDVENFFVKYFIELETLPQDRPPGSDALTEIAHSFWN
nr:hypothetical protein [uncultured Oscillibacter sp.]